jgi:YCII-related domain-containing protein
MSWYYFDVPVTYARYPPVLCWQPLGRRVVPLVYMRNSGASAGMDTASTRWARYRGSSPSAQPRDDGSPVGDKGFAVVNKQPHLASWAIQTRPRQVGLAQRRPGSGQRCKGASSPRDRGGAATGCAGREVVRAAHSAHRETTHGPRLTTSLGARRVSPVSEVSQKEAKGMTKFILLYKGPATPASEMTQDQTEKVMAGWQTWIERVGAALVDIGAPMANGASVVDDGSTGVPTELNGYSIVEADDRDGALALVEGHPFLSDGTGNFSVDVYELLPIPM